MNRTYRIGLDIGIGSVGWAVISKQGDSARIEDFGARIFDSGEREQKYRTSQERRAFRGARRVLRRRYYRKERLKRYLSLLRFLSFQQMNETDTSGKESVIELKVQGLERKLSPVELYRCLVHTCNHRGYRDFYETPEGEEGTEIDADMDEDSEEEKETAVNKKALQEFDAAFKASGLRTVSEYLWRDCRDEATNHIAFRNRDYKEERLLINRKHLRREIELILEKQRTFYPELTTDACLRIVDIIFAQRDFEDGPGNPEDASRRYTGFLDKLGICPFYGEQRGFRATVMGDIYAVVNALSQYRYLTADGELLLPKEAAKELLCTALNEARLTKSDVNAIMKKYSLKQLKGEGIDDNALAKSIKFMRAAKQAAEQVGMNWRDLIGETQFDVSTPSTLHRIAEVLAKYQTPRRRLTELKNTKLLHANDKALNAFARIKLNGTSAVSYRYMCDAIEAFLNGETYGNFQAAQNKKLFEDKEEARTIFLASELLKNEEIEDNPVVMRAINETRKVINAIIRTYGSPECINVEVASDLSRSFVERKKIQALQRDAEKANDKVRKAVAELLGITEGEVKGKAIEKYKLYELQEGKCLYSGKPLGDITEVLRDNNGKFEIDHIIPYSLILDNTLNNKALVFGSENQFKKQRCPLMYLKGDRAANFKAIVNVMRTRKENPISAKKYEYLMLEDLYTSKSREMLEAWKSRNINDTRYITKFIVSLLKNHLVFTGKPRVYGIKGAITSRFRRRWLNPKTWGSEQKDRNSYLNHAVDAIVIANLAPAYIEIAADAEKLNQIWKFHRGESEEYREYLKKAIERINQYYHMNPSYIELLLKRNNKTPSMVANLSDEIDIRMNDLDEELFNTKTEGFYGSTINDFVVKPHMPLVSHKPERRFRGAIADSNPIKLIEIDGRYHKVSRKTIQSITEKDIDRIRTNDGSLLRTLKVALANKGEKYTVEKYLKEIAQKVFLTDCGQPVYKVTVVDERPTSSYYRKENGTSNFSILGGLKYYCIEVYENNEGWTATRGIRYVDVIRENKKLYLKKESKPEDYARHIMYLFKGDYIETYNFKGKQTFMGFYQSAYNINENRFCGKEMNSSLISGNVRISSKIKIKKYDIDVLGKKCGEIKCFVPLSFK